MTSPALIGFDGSASATHAITTVRTILATSRAIVVTIFEPAMIAMGGFDTNLGGGTVEMNLETARIVEQASEDHAQRVCDQGAALARDAGFDTVDLEVVRDELNVAETLAQLAADHRAGAIVLGSHGHGTVRSRLLGSTSATILHRAHCPVIVVPRPAE